MTPLKTNKQTKHKQKIGEKKTNIDLAKMVSDCTIYIHIFSKKIYISPGKAPGLPSAGGSTILSIRRETPKPSISTLFMAQKHKFKKKELTCGRQNKQVANCTFSTSIKNHQVYGQPF